MSIPTVHVVQSFDAFVTSNSELIYAFVEDYQRKYGSVRLHVRVDAVITRDVDEGQQRKPVYFSTCVHNIDSVQQLDLQSVATDPSAPADHWNSRGSGFVLDRLTKFILCISKYRSLNGSKYIPTSQWLSKKKYTVNVKNTDLK